MPSPKSFHSDKPGFLIKIQQSFQITKNIMPYPVYWSYESVLIHSIGGENIESYQDFPFIDT